MNSDCRVPISTVADLVSTKVLVTELKGAPYISTENMLANLGGLGDSELPGVDRVNSFQPGDSLFSNIRPYFRKAHFAHTKGGCSADVLVFRTKDAKQFHPAYLYYCLVDPAFIQHTMATCKGAKMPRGDKGAMMRYEAFKPGIKTQTKIAGLLRSVDTLIEVLRHENTALESFAQTLFRSWFIDFDPVYAKFSGKEPEALSVERAALFPSEFAPSELGLIPKGWSVRTVEGLIKRLKPKQRYNIDETEPSGSVPIFDQSNSVLVGFGTVPGEVPATAKAPAFIFGDHTCVTKLSTRAFNVAPNVIPLTSTDRAGYWTFYAVRKLQAFEGYRRHWSDLIVRKVAVPDIALGSAFDEIAGPVHAYIDHNLLQVSKLAQLRDHILPRLISGKLCIDEAEEAVAAIASGPAKNRRK